MACIVKMGECLFNHCETEDPGRETVGVPTMTSTVGALSAWFPTLPAMDATIVMLREVVPCGTLAQAL